VRRETGLFRRETGFLRRETGFFIRNWFLEMKISTGDTMTRFVLYS
jgi:hypothetical protein